MLKLSDKVACVELREGLGLDDTVDVFAMLWYGYTLWKDDSEWIKKCMVEGAIPRGWPHRRV